MNKSNSSIRKYEQASTYFYQEEMMTAKYVETYHYVSNIGAVIQLHNHPFHEILHILKGKDIEYIIDSNRYFLEAGDVVVIPAGVSHSPLLYQSKEETYEREVLWLSCEFVNILAEQYPSAPFRLERHKNLLRTQGKEQKKISEYFHKGITEVEAQEKGWEVSLIGNTLQLLTLICRLLNDEDSHAPTPFKKNELIDNIMIYIRENLDKKITLKDVARRFYISESTLSHMFHSRMGVSFYRVVTQSRLLKAKTLLLEHLSAEEISRMVGYENYSTFYRAFHQEFGISPGNYRKSLTE